MPTSDPSAIDTPIFKPGDVVKVPFPYTDRPTRQRRPALVVSGPDLQRTHGLSWLSMITSATHRGWDGDVGILDLARAGLPAPSIVRCTKVATIDSRCEQFGLCDLRGVCRRASTPRGHVGL